MKIDKTSPLLFELGVNATLPGDKRLNEKEVKISPFVSIIEVHLDLVGEERLFLIKNNLTKHELFFEELSFLSQFNDWVVPDSIHEFEKKESSYYKLLNLYVNEIIETKGHEQSFRFLSPYLVNYDLIENIDYLCYYDPTIKRSIKEKLIIKYEHVLHFFNQQKDLSLDIIPLLIICNTSKEANKFYIETNNSNPRWDVCFPALRRALIVDVSKLNDEGVDSDEFTSEFVRSYAHILLYSVGERIPFWLEYGICNYFTQQYSVKETKYCNTQAVRLEDLDIINSLIFSSHVVSNDMHSQCASFTEFVKGIIGHGLFFDILHKVKYIENDFKNILLNITEIALDDLENFWMVYNNLSSKKYRLEEYQIVESQYYDEVLYFIQNVKNNQKVEIKDNELFELAELKSKIETILKDWIEPVYIKDVLKNNKDISFYLHPILNRLYQINLIQQVY